MLSCTKKIKGRVGVQLACAGAVLLAAGAAHAATCTWTPDTTSSDINGNWSDVYQAGTRAGWNAQVPNAADDVAYLTSGTAVTIAIDLDVNATIGALTANSRVGPVISTSSGKSLTLKNTSGTGTITQNGRNTLTFNVDIHLDNTNLSIVRTGGESGARAIDFNNAISGAGNVSVSVSNRGFVTLDGDVNNIGTLTLDNSTTSVAADFTSVSGNIGLNVTSVIKLGAGTVNLTGISNAYGDTVVNVGTLNVASSLGSGSVAIASGAILQLGGGIHQIVTGLTLGGILQTDSGTYGSLSSGATYKSAYFSGTGVVEVVPEPAALTMLALGGMMMLAGRRRS